MNNPFPEPLHFDNAGMIAGRRHVILTADFPCVTSLGRITVPRHTMIDGASIPQIAFSLIGHPFDAFLEDCVLHDFLYSKANREYTRSEADHLLRETMWNRKIPRWKIAAIWSAVRIGGWRSFKGQPQ